MIIERTITKTKTFVFEYDYVHALLSSYFLSVHVSSPNRLLLPFTTERNSERDLLKMSCYYDGISSFYIMNFHTF